MTEPTPPSTISPGARRLTVAALPGALFAVLAVVLAACGSGSSATPTTAGPSATTAAPAGSGGSATTAAPAGSGGGAQGATVKVATTNVGKALVTSTGMALYTYGPDHGAAMSTCTGACIQAWPPLTVPAGTTPHAGAGVSGALGTSKQSDGALQVTYNGNLLYTFLSDSSPGQVTGNGVAGFSAVKVAAPSSAAVATTTTSGGGYHY